MHRAGVQRQWGRVDLTGAVRARPPAALPGSGVRLELLTNLTATRPALSKALEKGLMTLQHIEAAASLTPPVGGLNQFTEHVRVSAMSVGTYNIAAGGIDDQTPHAEDEVYVVISGQARFTSGGDTAAVRPGTALFVPADEEHRFHDIHEDLAVLVIFAPAYSGRRA